MAIRVGVCMLLVLALGASGTAGFAAAASPAQRCQEGKNREAGKYALCRHKVEGKFALLEDAGARATALQRCAEKYAAKWPMLESKAAGACPSVGDQAAVQAAVDKTTLNVATTLAGGVLADCDADLTICTSELATCAAEPRGHLLKTGQASCYDWAGAPIPCAGTGQDGELRKGLGRAYIDNGDGTITDTKTGLMWEKLSDDDTIHDMHHIFAWGQAFVKAADLNAIAFAGFTDWRVPNILELVSILDFDKPPPGPTVVAAFDSDCVPGCTVGTCSCSLPGRYWSSTTDAENRANARTVWLYAGRVDTDGKSGNWDYVRAVRGGL
jgi:hypothetical protein